MLQKAITQEDIQYQRTSPDCQTSSWEIIDEEKWGLGWKNAIECQSSRFKSQAEPTYKTIPYAKRTLTSYIKCFSGSRSRHARREHWLLFTDGKFRHFSTSQKQHGKKIWWTWPIAWYAVCDWKFCLKRDKSWLKLKYGKWKKKMATAYLPK